ncbi:hypothetical protein QW71_27125 [Paenibacillus sp. IHB B 3415]|nr:hypothetical protein QW71_27125 [Paenibacillus sp. IHB B 3415]
MQTSAGELNSPALFTAWGDRGKNPFKLVVGGHLEVDRGKNPFKLVVGGYLEVDRGKNPFKLVSGRTFGGNEGHKCP